MAEAASSVSILFVIVHFILGTEQFSAYTGERISPFCMHDGRVGSQSGSIPVISKTNRTRTRLVESKFSRRIIT